MIEQVNANRIKKEDEKILLKSSRLHPYDPSGLNLSESEERCASLLLKTKKNWEISYELDLTLMGVSRIIKRLHKKLGTQKRRELILKLTTDWHGSRFYQKERLKKIH